MGKLLLLIFLFGLALSVFVIPVVRFLVRKGEERLEPVVTARFWQVQVHSEDPRFALDGRTAEVIHDFSKAHGRHRLDRISLNRICRNPYGEFFHVVIAAEDDSAYVNHLSEERARMVLQGAGVAMPPPVAMAQPGPDALNPQAPHRDVSRPDFPVGIPGAEEAARRAGEDAADGGLPTHPLARLCARLPTASLGLGTIVGFVGGIAYFGLAALRSGHWEAVNITALSHRLVLVIFAIGGLTLLNQARLGKKWSNKIWYERLTSLIALSVVGVLVSGLVNNLFSAIK